MHLAILICLAARALAQQVSGSIAGVAVDQSGSAVPGANVKLTDPDTRSERQLQSNAQGEFLFTAVPPGSYNVEIGANGFKRMVRENISLPPNERLSLGSLRLECSIRYDRASTERREFDQKFPPRTAERGLTIFRL